MVSLLQHNTFGIDHSCRRLLEPTSMEELHAMMPEIQQASPLLIIGAGSNLLLTQDFSGTVLHVCIKGIEMCECDDDKDYCLLRCGAGEVFDEVIEYAIEHQLYGMENLSLIPGEVGASAVQNIGAYGKEAKDVIKSVEAIDISSGQEVLIDNEECRYGYRYSRFKDEWRGQYVIHHVTFRLSRHFEPSLEYGNIRKVLSEQGNNAPTAADVRRAVIDIRKAKLPDPEVEGNAGSFFMNPIVSRDKYEELLKQYPSMPHYNVDAEHEKIPAGWMIEQCGWKGKSLGRAGVHANQALVLVNRGGATGQEVVNLSNAIRADVLQRFGIDIKPEVNIV